MGLESFSLQNQTEAILPPAKLIIALSSLSKVSLRYGILGEGCCRAHHWLRQRSWWSLHQRFRSCRASAGLGLPRCPAGRATCLQSQMRVLDIPRPAQPPIPSPAPLGPLPQLKPRGCRDRGHSDRLSKMQIPVGQVTETLALRRASLGLPNACRRGGVRRRRGGAGSSWQAGTMAHSDAWQGLRDPAWESDCSDLQPAGPNPA